MIRRRLVLSGLAVILVVAGAFAVSATRIPILQTLAESLIVAEPMIGRPDVIAVGIDAGSAGLLTAAELIHSGVANQVAVFVSPPGRVSAELRSRGIPYVDRTDLYARQLHALGIESIVGTPNVSGTKEQAEALPSWCDENGFSLVYLVTSWHHSRRAKRLLSRSMEENAATVVVVTAKYTDFDPTNWWASRDGARTVLTELQKLMLDILLHPWPQVESGIDLWPTKPYPPSPRNLAMEPVDLIEAAESIASRLRRRVAITDTASNYSLKPLQRRNSGLNWSLPTNAGPSWQKGADVITAPGRYP